MRNTRAIVSALALVAIVFAFAGCTVPADSGTKADEIVKEQDKAKTKDKTAEDKGPTETAGQENSRESAERYLDTSSFSRTGLIKQLKFEGFSIKDATYGVDAQHADWNKQAAASAQQYLDTSSFSHDGLVTQLKFEGFTPEQAEYGVKRAGL